MDSFSPFANADGNGESAAVQIFDAPTQAFVETQAGAAEEQVPPFWGAFQAGKQAGQFAMGETDGETLEALDRGKKDGGVPFVKDFAITAQDCTRGLILQKGVSILLLG